MVMRDCIRLKGTEVTVRDWKKLEVSKIRNWKKQKEPLEFEYWGGGGGGGGSY